MIIHMNCLYYHCFNSIIFSMISLFCLCIVDVNVHVYMVDILDFIVLFIIYLIVLICYVQCNYIDYYGRS